MKVQVSRNEAYNHINEIRTEYLQRGRLAEALAGAMWVVEKVFTKRGHFLLEFLQNAEDAKATKFQVVVTENAIEIYNNGNPFSYEDVESICSIGKSFKDPREYLGYLGVGFKAAFLISSDIRIYSYPYSFKFVKEEWPEFKNAPWQITPLWIEEVPEKFKNWSVAFELIAGSSERQRINEEIEKFEPRTLLFLHNLEEINLQWNGRKRLIRRSRQDNIWRLEVTEGEKQESSNWIVFSRIVTVPPEIRNDPFTKEWRRDVAEKREIAVAFSLDNQQKPVPVIGTVRVTSVHSYLPLREEAGLSFLIQGDFLTPPGRDSIQREAPWNIWLLRELTTFIKEEVIPLLFKQHSEWRFCYTPILYCCTTHPLFESSLTQPLREELERGKHLIDEEGNFVNKDEVAKVSEHIVQALGKDYVKKLLGRKILHPKCEPARDFNIRQFFTFRDYTFYLYDVASIKAKFGEEWKEVWRRVLLGLAEEFYSYSEFTRASSRYQDEFRNYTRVFDEQEKPGNPFYPYYEVCIASPEVITAAKILLPGYFRFLHPSLADQMIVKYLKDLGAKELSYEDLIEVMKKRKIPQLFDELHDPNTLNQRKIELVKQIKELYEQGYIKDLSRLIIPTKSGKWLKPHNVLLGSKYQPEEIIEELVRRKLLKPEYEFISDEFIEEETEAGVLRWREFLHRAGIGSAIDRGPLVQKVALNMTLYYETVVQGIEEVKPLSEADATGKGYDVESKMPDGTPKYIEVKGRSGEDVIELTEAQYKLAMSEQKRTFVYIVSNALRNPELHIIQASSLLEFLPRLRLSPSEWKRIRLIYWRLT